MIKNIGLNWSPHKTFWFGFIGFIILLGLVGVLGSIIYPEGGFGDDSILTFGIFNAILLGVVVCLYGIPYFFSVWNSTAGKNMWGYRSLLLLFGSIISLNILLAIFQ